MPLHKRLQRQIGIEEFLGHGFILCTSCHLMHTKLPDTDKLTDAKLLILLPMKVQISARKLGSFLISHDAGFSCSLSTLQRLEKMLMASFNVY